MTIFPFEKETIVSSLNQEEIEQRLENVLNPTFSEGKINYSSGNHWLFNGYLKNGKFRISRVIKAPQNFLPLIIGEIESTSLGSIIFLKYRLFRSTIVFLSAWSLLSVSIGSMFLILYQEIIYAIIAYSLGIINYAIAIANFSRELKTSRKVLYELFN